MRQTPKRQRQRCQKEESSRMAAPWMKRFFSKTRFPSYYKDNERKGEKQRGEGVDTGAGVVILGTRFVISGTPFVIPSLSQNLFCHFEPVEKSHPQTLPYLRMNSSICAFHPHQSPFLRMKEQRIRSKCSR